ncbi:MAG: peptide chain release factor N(5)-glutamine methyltransferase [Candidatus Brocadiae bacterium]|nr:peptide chain release factor N(5)-glutamine methyltransferase [Candidatus Brocadiia bacterium]
MSQAHESHQGPWTTLKLLGWTTQFFESKGIDTARLDAELLLATAMGCRRIELYARYDDVPPPDALARFRQWVKQRGQRVPAKYLIGETEFYSLSLAVTPSVLIPRPETELLVERALQALPEGQDALVADLGTGSGAVAIALASQRPQARVLAVDASVEALELARVNAQRHQLAERITFLHGNWFDALSDGVTCDVVVSNPPYVARAELAATMPEVREHEPRLALDGGDDGLDALRVIVAGAPAWLKPGGWLFVEIGASQGPAVRQLAEQTGDYETVDVSPDFQGLDRIVSMQKKA